MCGTQDDKQKKRHVNMPSIRSLILNAQITINIYSAWVSRCSSPCLKTTPKELKTNGKWKKISQWVP